MPEGKPISITDDQFREEVLKKDGVSVVDFWAPWCGPCLQMAPGLEAFAQANEGKVRVFKLDVDDNPKTAEKYEIRSIPTIIFFLNGEPVYTSRGTMTQVGSAEAVRGSPQKGNLKAQFARTASVGMGGKFQQGQALTFTRRCAVIPFMVRTSLPQPDHEVNIHGLAVRPERLPSKGERSVTASPLTGGGES